MSSPPSASFGAVTMGDKRYRKACDRCHLHKQSCTRANEDRCDRCTKLGAECMISLSEKQAKQYQKQPKPQPKPQQKSQQAQKQKQHPQQLLQQHQHQQQEQEPAPAQAPPFPHNGKLSPSRPQVAVVKQQQQSSFTDSASVSVSTPTPDTTGTGNKTALVRSRSPKRRRTDSDPSLVLPDTDSIASQGPSSHHLDGRLGSDALRHAQPRRTQPHNYSRPPAGSDSSGSDKPPGVGEFNFRLEPLSFVSPNQTDYLLQPLHPPAPSIQPFQYPLTQQQNHLPHHQSVYNHPWNSQQLSLASNSFSAAPSNSNHQTNINPDPSLYPSVPSLDLLHLHQHHHLHHQQSLHHHHHHPSLSSHPPPPLRGKEIAPRQTEDTYVFTQVGWMTQFTEINDRLKALAAALPKPQETAQNGPPLNRPTDERYSAHGYPLDDVFRLTGTVADTLERLAAEGAEANSQADPPDAMYILSTYVRLLQMYQSIFGLVRLELTQRNWDASFLYWAIPDLQIGSIIFDATPLYHMSLAVRAARGLLTRLRGATAALNSTRSSTGDDGRSGTFEGADFSEAVDVSYQAIKGQEEALRKHMAELHAEMEKLLDAFSDS